MRRGQIDLIDMTLDCDGDFKYIGHYIDHFTKFNFLWPQQRKKASEVARCIIENVFSIVGLPLILQHDNGAEFCNKVMILGYFLPKTPVYINLPFSFAGNR
jgi:hypothetical protein